jgi:sugar O-acyltransferase (sialic acid O-acetyltransferase NeuD family)
MTDSGPTRPLIIVAAGRQGRNVRDACAAAGIEIQGFLDDSVDAGARINDVSVLGGFELIGDPDLVSRVSWLVALGDNQIRRDLSQKIQASGGVLQSVIHPTCDISPWSDIGAGVYIASFSRILPNTRIGDYALIEGSTHIGADNQLGEAVFIGPGCTLTGGSRIGDCAFVGAGSVVLDKGVIGAGSLIGAGATVVSEIPDNSVAVGTPACVTKTLG